MKCMFLAQLPELIDKNFYHYNHKLFCTTLVLIYLNLKTLQFCTVILTSTPFNMSSSSFHQSAERPFQAVTWALLTARLIRRMYSGARRPSFAVSSSKLLNLPGPPFLYLQKSKNSNNIYLIALLGDEVKLAHGVFISVSLCRYSSCTYLEHKHLVLIEM